MNISKYIPKQKRMSTAVGGFLVLVSETMFMMGLVNFILISRIQYYNPGDSYIRDIFPYYTLFMIFMSICGLITMVFIYIVVIPSKTLFGNIQGVKDDRSPIYNLLVEINEDIQKIKQEIEILKTK